MSITRNHIHTGDKQEVHFHDDGCGCNEVDKVYKISGVSCCNNRKVCSIHDYRKLDELVYRIKDRITELSFQKVQSLFYPGYYCAVDIDNETNKLNILKDSLSRVKLSFLHIRKSCLDDKTIQLIVEKTVRIIGKGVCPEKRVDFIIDDSGLNAYMVAHPACITYDSWNKFANFICGAIGVTITAEVEKCDFVFEVSRKIIPCNVLFALSVHREMCDLKFKVNRTKDECAIDYTLLIEQVPECNLNFKTYLSYVHKHNLSFPIIKEIYSSGLTLATIEDDVTICTPINNYSLKEITPTSLQELLDLGFVVELTKFDIKQDYRKI